MVKDNNNKQNEKRLPLMRMTAIVDDDDNDIAIYQSITPYHNPIH